MTNLLDSVKDMMTDAVIGKVAGMIGEDASSTTSALGKFLPAIIGGVINKGNTESGAAGLLDMFKSGGFGDVGVDDLLGVLGGGDTQKSDSWLETGADLLGSIFGNKQSGLLDALLGMTGLKKSGGSMLLKILAPIVINKLAGMVFKNNWGASKLSSFLSDQKSSVDGLVPGLSGLLGFSASKADDITSTTSASSGSDSGGGGWMKWLLPLLLGAAALWWFTKDGCNKGSEMDDTATMVDTTATMEEAPTTTETTTTIEQTSVSDSEDLSKYSLADNGDIVDGSGTVRYKGGSYGLDKNGNVVDDKGRILVSVAKLPKDLVDRLRSYLGKFAGSRLMVDQAGNLVDESGKVIFAKSDFVEKDGFYYDKQGNKLGRIWSQIIASIEKTLEAMKGMFAKMVKKEAGAENNYILSDIEFNTENHRITNFSKAEVEGLAAALKENTNGKIVVQAFTDDGKSDKENKELSKTRAQVVHDMLVTLGVNKGQISFEGMGSGADKVSIAVK